MGEHNWLAELETFIPNLHSEAPSALFDPLPYELAEKQALSLVHQ